MTTTLAEGAVIVLPTEDDFPIDESLTGHALAEDYFAFVLAHTRLEDWDFELVPEDPADPAAVLAGMPHHMTEPLAPGAEPGDADSIPEGDPLPILYAPSAVETPEL